MENFGNQTSKISEPVISILHVAESFSGGVSDFIFNLVRNMPQHKHTILYGLRDQNYSINDIENKFNKYCDLIIWRNASREISISKDYQALLELNKLISTNNYHVIHLHSSKAGFIGRLVALFNRKKQWLYTTHCIAFLRKDITFIAYVLYVLLEWIASKLPGSIIACSKSEYEVIRSKGIQCFYINNSIPKIDLVVDNKEEDESIKIVTMGRITAQKGPEIFNSIAEKLFSFKNISFIWVGDGELKDKLHSNNISITGWVSKMEVYKQLNNADIYLSTALWEGLPLAVLDAMIVKMPLLLSNSIGNKDCVIEGENGFIFNSIDEAVNYCKELIKNKQVLREMGEKSFQYFNREFNFDNFIQSYNALYTSNKY